MLSSTSFQKFLSTNSHSSLIFLVAFIAHLLFFVVFSVQIGPSVFWNGPEDVRAYTTLAHNILDLGSYQNINNASPASWYPPGYPFFLAVVFAVFRTWYMAIFIQILLASLSAVLVYQIGRNSFSEGVGFVAGLIFALDPYSAMVSSFLWSETLFIFFVLLAIKYFLCYQSSQSLPHLLGMGCFLAIATYIRELALFLPLLLLGGMITWEWSQKSITTKMILRCIGTLLLFVLLLLPWMARNQKIFGTYALSAQSIEMVYFYDAIPFTYYRNANSSFAYYLGLETVSSPEGNPYPLKQTSEYHYSGTGGLLQAHELRQKTWAIISQHPFSYTTFHLMGGIGGILFQENWRPILRRLDYSPDAARLAQSVRALNFRSFLEQLNMKSITWIMVGLMGHAEAILMSLLALYGFIKSLVSKKRNEIFISLFCAIMITYVIVATGPAAYRERYRYPAIPFLALLAANGLLLLRPKSNNLLNLTNRKEKYTKNNQLASK